MAHYTNKPCDVCDDKIKATQIQYGNMYYCDECWAREQESVKAHTPVVDEEQRKRNELADRINRAMIEGQLKYGSNNAAAIPINQVLRDASIADHNIQVRTDLFNAATKSINELKEAIDKDENITNKPYALAETLKTRFEHFKTVIFDLNQKVIEAGNEQRAIQTYLNTMSNQLRAEEREKLKISDINYKPTPPKAIKVKTIGTSTTGRKPKVDKNAVRNAAKELGVSEFMVQMLVVSKGLSVEQAKETIKKSIEAAKG